MQDYNDTFMTRAFVKAHEALAIGEVPIGCVFVGENDQVISETRNTVNQTKNATRHAEINAVDDVEKLAKDRGVCSSSIYPTISVYVNVEPCIMCAAALMKVRVKAIYYGCANDKFGGCGSVGNLEANMAELAPDYRVKVSGGHRAPEAIQLLKEFYNGENPYAPNPKVKGVKLKKEQVNGESCSS
ncbi:tRNA-specific adenosine deaminase 2-like [Eurytemora carolleeae]|uniref:tRNA-specific adenosine deaminase 2-like n=1 Tax=Eurytemora carolleeae TaxID=1294199 RepID=UPI000C769DD2|nr:tRNA-specific adenosine deaminase 2-like [Eurytemora carolleeae]|eukprot:XP_023330547.1 tRNA-specific adenosine deaminase 2-like [Eurytemora affinis]